MDPTEIEFLVTPRTVQKDASFKRSPIIVMVDNLPPVYCSFWAKIRLRDGEDGRSMNQCLSGTTLVSPVFDETDNRCYFKMKRIKITETGRFSIELQLYGVLGTPELGDYYITSKCTSSIRVSDSAAHVHLTL
ncbi:unnamed protein product [Clonostachys rosea]|uniref:Velvet domain-containing protein n=1 Tax=Bionectria ochroleuca TaxID=29856 RepID=A0ABY6V2P1_BIOOC|nr:unnamed protein product [Clonostachys rosea]